MYAMTRRYDVGQPRRDDLAEISHRLGMAFGSVPGFVASVAVDEAGGGLLIIGLFEDHPSLVAAEAVAERWMATYQLMPGPRFAAATIGEVVAQRGL